MLTYTSLLQQLYRLWLKELFTLGPSSTISQMVNEFEWSVKFINHLTDSRGRALLLKVPYLLAIRRVDDGNVKEAHESVWTGPQ